ncbi:MAG: hypothetical protein M1465_01650 [Candidatus Marsarchaeota archaeon]|jgi:hypothetical protein|nr:hypothetical protein [Candidatus Marsarchaeota archaeon]
MVVFDNKFGAYICERCLLHYESEELAKKCEAWDKEHNSCNMVVARQSIEAKSRKEALKQ